MKKIHIISWIIIFCMTIAAVISMIFLPGELAVQWNLSGVSNTAPKWIVIVFPAIAALCVLLNKAQNAKSDAPEKNGAGYFLGVLIALVAQIVIIVSNIIS